MVLAVLALAAVAVVPIAPAPSTVALARESDEAVDPRTGASSRAGAPIELREKLADEEPIWEALRAQYRYPVSPPPSPYISGVREAASRLTLRDAVLTAVQNNPQVIAESLTPLAQETGILEAQAQFDPIVGAEASWARLAAPSSNVLTDASESDTLRVTTIDSIWNFGIGKALRTGGFLDLSWDNERLTNDARLRFGDQSIPFQLFSPQFTPELAATLTQPLLRDFGLYFTNLRIQIAETATDAAIERYKAAVANFIRGVVANYWAVVGLEERVEVLEGSLELAQKTVRDNQTRVDVGVLPPVAVLESQAEAARRQEDVIVAQNDLVQARLQLRQQVYLPSDNPFLPRAVEPVDRPNSEKVEVVVEESLQLAMEKRPEIQAARLSIEGSELNTAITKNQRLPRLDLFGSTGLNSLAGVNTTPQIERFEGGYGDSLNFLFDGRFYSYSAGVRIEVPIGNAQANARATRARVEEQQAYDRYRQTVSEVSLEVGQAIGDMLSDQERIETTRVARELSEQNLRNQTKRYEVGMVTTTDLLKFQNDLATAKVAEIQALIEYSISRTEFERAQGTLLGQYNVTVEPRGETYTPWWARF